MEKKRLTSIRQAFILPSLTVRKIKNGYKPSKHGLCSRFSFRNDMCYIDTENGLIRLKLAVDLARKLKADYFKLEDLNAETLAGVVSETVKFS